MDKIDAIRLGFIGLIAIISLFAIVYGGIKHENNLIEQSDTLGKICLKAYKSDLKNDDEIKELCKGVKVKLFEDR